MFNLSFNIMKKIALLFVGITIVALFFAFPQQTKSESFDCIYPAWAHDVGGVWKVDCPTFSGNTHCWADCNAIPGPGPNSNR